MPVFKLKRTKQKAHLETLKADYAHVELDWEAVLDMMNKVTYPDILKLRLLKELVRKL